MVNQFPIDCTFPRNFDDIIRIYVTNFLDSLFKGTNRCFFWCDGKMIFSKTECNNKGTMISKDRLVPFYSCVQLGLCLRYLREKVIDLLLIFFFFYLINNQSEFFHSKTPPLSGLIYFTRKTMVMYKNKLENKRYCIRYILMIRWLKDQNRKEA